MLFLLSWSLQPLWSARRLHLNPAQQRFPSSKMTPTSSAFTPHVTSSRNMAALRLCPRLLQRQIQKKTQQIRLMPSSGRIPQVQICCVLVQTIPPSFLESNQLFPFHTSSQSSPSQPLIGPPDPASPVCAGVVTPQAIMYGQVLSSASLYVQCLTQLVILVMIWGVTNTQTAPVSSVDAGKCSRSVSDCLPLHVLCGFLSVTTTLPQIASVLLPALFSVAAFCAKKGFDQWLGIICQTATTK